jgi:hypothetical protein
MASPLIPTSILDSITRGMYFNSFTIPIPRTPSI